MNVYFVLQLLDPLHARALAVFYPALLAWVAELNKI